MLEIMKNIIRTTIFTLTVLIFFDTHVCIAGVVNNFIGLLNKCTN